jgi:tRNA-intron endonuclease, archaea type
VSGVVGPGGDAVLTDPDEVSLVHGRGYYGTVTGGALALDRFETVYLAEAGRVDLVDGRGRSAPWPRIFRAAARADRDFDVRYVVYRDLRQRGYVVRANPPPAAFAVLPRGGVLNKTPARYWVAVETERTPFDLAGLMALAERALSARKQLLLALVDEESDLTYYRVRRPDPKGTLALPALDAPAEGWLSGDRVVVFGPAAATLGDGAAFGSRIGERLEVSVLEAEFLRAAGRLALRDVRSARPVSVERFRARARRLEPGFEERLAAYQALRGRGLIVKTGFKYGAHFRVYVRAPDRVHARYLVRALRLGQTVAWPEISGGVRLAQGVRKEFLIAGVEPSGTVRFLALERIRP